MKNETMLTRKHQLKYLTMLVYFVIKMKRLYLEIILQRALL